MISFPNAKINIGLYVTEKRSDGYHNLQSIFYPIDWKDILEITKSSSGTTTFRSTGIPIPGENKDNLCLKAYHLLRSDFNLPAVAIHLHKIIPIGAGLGGGSADASYTLKTLNALFELKLNTEQLKGYAQKLGSDCAFFIDNTPVIALEKGDVFKPCSLSLNNKWVILINPGIHISTQKAYANIRLDSPSIDLSHIESSTISEWKNYLTNSFEKSVGIEFPLIAEIKNDLYNAGAQYASMTGSGSTIYGVFDHEPAEANFQKEGCTVKKLKLN